MLYSKIRVRTILLILLITNLVNFYQAYAVPPQKTYEALSSDDSSESSDCYYSDSEGYCADSEESSDDDTLLHPGEYPEKTSFSNPIPRRKNKNWSHCSSGTKELCNHFGESLDSSGSSPSKRCSGSTSSPYFRKSSNSSDSYSSEECSGSDASPCSRESLSSKKRPVSDVSPCFRKSSNSSDSYSSEECSGSDASPCSRESLSSKKRPVSDVSPCFRKSSNSSDSYSSEECSGSDDSPCSRESLSSKKRPVFDVSSSFRKSSSSSDSYSSEECSGSDAPPFFRKSPNPSPSSSKKHSDSDASPSSWKSPSSSGSSPSKELRPTDLPYFQVPPELYFPYFTKQFNSPLDCKSQKPPLTSSDGKVSSLTTTQNLNPALKERNLVMDYIIENISSHMADRATIARQRIKCYIKDLFSNKSLYNQLSPELLVTVMYYWDRINYVKLIRDTQDEKNELDRFFYTLITLFCIADKFAGDDLHDATIPEWAEISFELKPKLKDKFTRDDLHSFTVRKWAVINWIFIPKLIHYEKVLLENLDYRLYISQEDYLYYQKILKSCPKSR